LKRARFWYLIRSFGAGLREKTLAQSDGRQPSMGKPKAKSSGGLLSAERAILCEELEKADSKN
jgi:hypothetical protein